MSALAVGRFRFAPVLAATVLTVLVLMLFGRAAEVFLLLFVAILISLYLGALADLLTRRVGLPRKTAIFVGVAISLAALTGLFWLIVPPVVEQTQGLVRVLPTYISNWEAGIERMIARFPAMATVWQPGQHTVLHAVAEQMSGYFGDVLPKVAGFLHGAVNLFAVAIMGLYLALDPGSYREFLIALFPPVHRDLVRNVLSDLATTLRRWIVGQMLGMTILGAFTAAGLWLLDVPYWLTFGVFTGVVAIVPFFGSLVSTVLPALFALAGNGIWGMGPGAHALLVVLLGVVVHIFEGNIVAPKIFHRAINLPPVLTIMGVLIMGKLLGPVGLLVAVPTVATIMVVVRRILISRIYEGQGFRRFTRDNVLRVRAPAPDGAVILPAAQPVDMLADAEAVDPLQAA